MGNTLLYRFPSKGGICLEIEEVKPYDIIQILLRHVATLCVGARP